MANDLAEVAARFGAELRRAGLPVGPGRSERFAAAVTIARPETLDALYRCALATLVSGRDEIDALRAVFNRVFGGLDDPAGRRGDQNSPAMRPPTSPEDLLAMAARAAKSHVSDTQPARPGCGRGRRGLAGARARDRAPLPGQHRRAAGQPRTSPTCPSPSCCCWPG